MFDNGGVADAWPVGYQATFQVVIYPNCPGIPATLQIASSDSFVLTLNGVTLANNLPLLQSNSVTLNFNCGKNILNIAVTKGGLVSGPAAFIFTLTQDQSTCTPITTTCDQNLIATYNRDTCQCTCPASTCSSALQSWVGYPVCGCQCSNVLSCS